MTNVNSNYSLPLTLNASVDTMKEKLAICESPLSADSRHKLVAIHRPLTEDQHSTELIGLKQRPHPGIESKIETVLVEIPEASHGIARKPSNLISKVAHTLAWFKKYNE